MIAPAKKTFQSAAILRESPSNLSVVPPETERPRGDQVALAFMLIACAIFAGAFVVSILIPAIKTLMGT